MSLDPLIHPLPLYIEAVFNKPHKGRVMSQSEFPADVTQAAIDACAAAYGKDWSVGRIVIHAIVAERERCARIADEERQAHNTGSGFDSQPAHAAAFRIAAAIRAGATCQ